jgi:dipeptidase E
VWRAHGLDEILREAWHAGVVLCGLSAGSLCWFTEGVTAFHGPPQRVEGLGLLPCSNTVHYDREPGRRPAFHEFVRAGMPDGYAVDDGAALHFVDEELHAVVASKSAARAYRVETTDAGVVETELETRFLGAPAVLAA